VGKAPKGCGAITWNGGQGGFDSLLSNGEFWTSR
jgi:hypothetical protein